MAKDVAKELGLEERCVFYEADATIDPELFFSGTLWRIIVGIVSCSFLNACSHHYPP
jgi:hypothetical protein